MKIYFSADYHLDHANIIKYTDRPFIHPGDLNEEKEWVSLEIKRKRCQEMNYTIIDNHNKVLTYEDKLYHIGDFSYRYTGPAIYWEQFLNGKIVHIRGNHDNNNGTNTYITHCLMEFGGVLFYVVHKPPEDNQVDTLQAHIISMCNGIICGHVHNSWKWKWITVQYLNHKVRKPCINVGIDVWDYKPISIHSILKLLAKINKGLV